MPHVRTLDEWCAVCGRDLDSVAYGDCVVCERFVCEACDAGYNPDSGQSVCPAHADHPDAAEFEH